MATDSGVAVSCAHRGASVSKTGTMARGQLRIYLGAAPGVGKTFAMLNEGRRRASRGSDVVIGAVDTHGRERVSEQIGDLEVIPPHRVRYRRVSATEMDVDAILERRPEVVLVDELAHTNVAGSRNHKRYQDVDELLDAGIVVVSTLNIQHLESLSDVVESITGVAQRETIPDEFVRGADQVELVDMTPEALRRRLAHGNVADPDRVDTEMDGFFEVGNLTALRELALLWIAGRVDDELDDYRARHGVEQPWETRERIVVAVSGAPGTGDLIRRAARIADRTRSDLLGVHVRTGSDPQDGGEGMLGEHRRLLTEVGGGFHEVQGKDVAKALMDFAAEHDATQIVVGSTRRTRFQELTSGSIVNRMLRIQGGIDIHVIADDRT